MQDPQNVASSATSALRSARLDAGLTLRQLAARCGTSHPTLSAYEAGRKVPTARTLARILRHCGYALEVHRRRAVPRSERIARGEELAQVLALAERFPAKRAKCMPNIRFGHS